MLLSVVGYKALYRELPWTATPPAPWDTNQIRVQRAGDQGGFRHLEPDEMVVERAKTTYKELTD